MRLCRRAGGAGYAAVATADGDGMRRAPALMPPRRDAWLIAASAVATILIAALVLRAIYQPLRAALLSAGIAGAGDVPFFVCAGDAARRTLRLRLADGSEAPLSATWVVAYTWAPSHVAAAVSALAGVQPARAGGLKAMYPSIVTGGNGSAVDAFLRVSVEAPIVPSAGGASLGLHSLSVVLRTPLHESQPTRAPRHLPSSSSSSSSGSSGGGGESAGAAPPHSPATLSSLVRLTAEPSMYAGAEDARAFAWLGGSRWLMFGMDSWGFGRRQHLLCVEGPACTLVEPLGGARSAGVTLRMADGDPLQLGKVEKNWAPLVVPASRRGTRRQARAAPAATAAADSAAQSPMQSSSERNATVVGSIAAEAERLVGQPWRRRLFGAEISPGERFAAAGKLAAELAAGSGESPLLASVAARQPSDEQRAAVEAAAAAAGLLDERLLVVYAYDPLWVLECSIGGVCRTIHGVHDDGGSGDASLPRPLATRGMVTRGSTPFLPLRVPGVGASFYWGFVHSNVEWAPAASVYQPHLLVLQHDVDHDRWSVLAVSSAVIPPPPVLASQMAHLFELGIDPHASWYRLHAGRSGTSLQPWLLAISSLARLPHHVALVANDVGADTLLGVYLNDNQPFLARVAGLEAAVAAVLAGGRLAALPRGAVEAYARSQAAAMLADCRPSFFG